MERAECCAEGLSFARKRERANARSGMNHRDTENTERTQRIKGPDKFWPASSFQISFSVFSVSLWLVAFVLSVSRFRSFVFSCEKAAYRTLALFLILLLPLASTQAAE